MRVLSAAAGVVLVLVLLIRAQEDTSAAPAAVLTPVVDTTVETPRDTVARSAPQPEDAVADTPAVENAASLVVTTQPEGAVVVLDDNPCGRTPVTLEDILPGPHVIVLKKKGYFVKKVAVSVSAGAREELEFLLVAPARLAVTSDPVATVAIDGADKGNTPLVVGTLKPGTHEIVVRAEGGRNATRKVTLENGGADSLHFALQPAGGSSTEPGETTISGVREPGESRVSSVLNRVALGVFVGFSLLILLIELTQGRE